MCTGEDGEGERQNRLVKTQFHINRLNIYTSARYIYIEHRQERSSPIPIPISM